MRLVLLGPPGAGKGTQAGAIKSALSVPHISTGEMLRSAIAAGTPVGRRAKAIVEGGNLVPDDVMAEMVRERLGAADVGKGFLLDGYPRNVGQARTLEAILSEASTSLDGVLYLDLADAEIVRRLSGRRTCASCGAVYNVAGAPPAKAGRCDACGGALAQRSDDKEEIVAQRMGVYRAQTEPLIAFYERGGLLRRIDASGSVAAVTARALEAVKGVRA